MSVGEDRPKGDGDQFYASRKIDREFCPKGRSPHRSTHILNMGRYAYFHSTNKTKAPEAETVCYKFWFACQSSEIPWARDSIQYFINDYDEDHGLDLTPEQDAWWQKHADDYYPDPSSLPNDIKEILDDIGHEQYVAEDDDSDLDEYWDQRDRLLS